jgi:hypothetical protein
MPSSGSRPHACAARTCGHTAASSRLPSRPRWGTSTAASLRRSAAKSPPSNLASSSLAYSSPPTTPALNCQLGYQSSCQHAEFVGTAQAPLLRVPLADGTLVASPDVPSGEMVPSLLALSDVMVWNKKKQSRQGVRPDLASRSGGGGLPRNGRSQRNQDAATPNPMIGTRARFAIVRSCRERSGHEHKERTMPHVVVKLWPG